MIDALIIVLICTGTLLSIIGVLGMVRLPDVYARMHATGKVGALGVAMLLVASKLAGAAPLGVGFLMIVMIVLAGPVLSSAIAASARAAGVKGRGIE